MNVGKKQGDFLNIGVLCAKFYIIKIILDKFFSIYESYKNMF